MKKYLFTLAAAMMSFGCIQAQQLEGAGAPTNINPEGYPRIIDGNRIVFHIKAPQADKVQVAIGKTYDLSKDENGLWKGTTEPLLAGFHYYSLVIDGVDVSDPASKTFYGCNRMMSAIDIPENNCDFYTVKDVPHGAILSLRYYSKVMNAWRPVNVYLPASYSQSANKKYPVVYIQHGGGEDESGWAVQGKTDIIMDNLIAQGKAKEMIVVMANGNVTMKGFSPSGYNRHSMIPFQTELLENIIPFIESHFRVWKDAPHRALCGLSMGGGQSFYVGLQNTATFGNIGIFSSGIFGGIASPSGTAFTTHFDAEKEIPGLISNHDKFNKALKVLYISVGTDDPRIHATTEAVDMMQKEGLKITFNTFPGNHEWQVWRKSLHAFAQLLFK